LVELGIILEPSLNTKRLEKLRKRGEVSMSRPVSQAYLDQVSLSSEESVDSERDLDGFEGMGQKE